MRKTIILFIAAFPLFAFGQSTESVKVVLNAKIETSFDSSFFHPSSIKSVNVDATARIIYIQTKDTIWRYKTIDDILKVYPLYPQLVTYRTLTPIFYVDDKLINKITDAKIDKSLFTEVVFKDLGRVSYIDMLCRNIVIVDIKIFNKPNIRIRGNSLDKIENSLKTEK